MLPLVQLREIPSILFTLGLVVITVIMTKAVYKAVIYKQVFFIGTDTEFIIWENGKMQVIPWSQIEEVIREPVNDKDWLYVYKKSGTIMGFDKGHSYKDEILIKEPKNVVELEKQINDLISINKIN